MSLYNFIILRKKRICKTFKGSGGCFWKHVTYYYVIKNYIGHKLAIFSTVIFILWDLLLTRWWDMRLMHDVAWLWEEQADSRNLCRNKKKYCSCCITLIRINTILSKNIYNDFQNMLFRKLLIQLHDQTDIFWKFYLPADILWSTLNCWASVRLHHCLFLAVLFGWFSCQSQPKKKLLKIYVLFVNIIIYFYFLYHVMIQSTVFYSDWQENIFFLSFFTLFNVNIISTI